MLCGFFACSNPKKAIQPGSYFDIPSFFEKQIELLNTKKPRLVKRVQTNGKSAEVVKDSANWSKELALFRSFNLNKAAFIGKFSVDSFVQEDRLTLMYKANDEKISIKSVRIQFTKNEVNWIEANKSDQNALFINSLVLRFTVDSGFAISGVECLNGLAKSSYTVSARILND
jgi:hypothetical protein